MPTAASVATVPWLFTPSDTAYNIALNADFIATGLYLNILAYGGVADGTTDNTAALTKALAALTGSGGTIFFPAGSYNFTSAPSYSHPTGVFSVSLIGAGQEATTLIFQAGGITFNYAGFTSSVHIRDMTFAAPTAAAGTAITLSSTVNNNNSLFALSDISNVCFRGNDGYFQTDYWTTCIAVVDVSNVNFLGLSVNGSSSRQGIGINLAGAVSTATYATVFNIDGCVFQYLQRGLIYGSYVQGVTINRTNFTDVINMVFTAAGTVGNLDQLSITNSQWNAVVGSANGLALNVPVAHLMIANNYFICNASTSVALNIQSSQGTMIVGNSFVGSGSPIQIAIQLVNTNAAPCAIIGNFINNFSGASSSGIILGASASQVVVAGNGFANMATVFTNGGTNNVAVYNEGLNPVGIAAPISMVSSPFNYTAGAYPETHYLRQFSVNDAVATKGGQTVAALINASSYYVIELGPNESYQVTWAGAGIPQYTKDQH